MGKGSNLWDDSALINAFDNAMATYKQAMHSKTYHVDSPEEEKHTSDNNGKELVLIEKITGEGSSDHTFETCPFRRVRHMEQEDNDNSVSNNATESYILCSNTEVASEDFPIQENNLSADLHAPESHTQSSDFPRTDGRIDSYSDQQLDYNHLLRQYYELEEQKQKVVQQLHQASYWNYQTAVHCSNCHAHLVPAFDTSQHDLHPACSPCSCNCLAAPSIPACAIGGPSSGGYGCCPAWTACCSASQAHTGLQCSAGSGTCSLVTSCLVNPMKQSTADDNALKIGMMAAERAISSMQKGISAISNVCEETEKGEDKEEGSGTYGGKGSQKISLETDLAAVLSAWYAAGFHTGRYLMEQSKRDMNQ